MNIDLRANAMRQFLPILISFVSVGYARQNAADQLPIVRNSIPNAAIVIPIPVSSDLKTAATMLADYVRKSTGALLPLEDSSNAIKSKTAVRIWLGTSKYSSEMFKRIGHLKNDGFVIMFPTANDVAIVSPTDLGVQNGVYEFLERYIGVRWLFPGIKGEVVPHRSSLVIPKVEIKQEPAFSTRLLSGLIGPEQALWARRNRMVSTIVFHHNMANIIPVCKYGKSNPEFFPIQKGKRIIPDPSNESGWQPCFSAPGLVDTSILQIKRFFATHKDIKSFSLGVNDAGGFCVCDNCLRAVNGKKNVYGYPDYSNLYYRWVDKVVSGVLQEYPDKKFGCLAYREVMSPPDTVVNDAVTPFITGETIKWADDENRKEAESMTKQWSSVARQLGWYDYVYGTPYLVPRVYIHTMSESYKFMNQNGVREMYAEAYPNFGEGPKPYIVLKLMWNPQLDADKVVDDWCLAAVGAQSSPYLKKYLFLWDDFWSNRIVKSAWFQTQGIYLHFFEPSYLNEVKEEDIKQSRSLLESVLEHVTNEDEKVRATILLKAFEYYEASYYAYDGLVKGIKVGNHPQSYYEGLNTKRKQLIDAFENDPALVHQLRFDKYDELRFSK